MVVGRETQRGRWAFPRRRPSPAMLVALVALFVALGGRSNAALRIASKQIADNSVRGVDLRNGDVGTKDIREGSSRRRDFQAGQLIAGEGGPAGPQGAQGVEGPSGAPGDRSATRRRTAPPVDLATNPADDDFQFGGTTPVVVELAPSEACTIRDDAGPWSSFLVAYGT